MNSELLGVPEVATLLKCSKRAVIKWRDAGVLPPALKVGRLVRWRRGDIDQWIEGGCIPWHRTQAPRRGRARA